jgi:hypothetical protein
MSPPDDAIKPCPVCGFSDTVLTLEQFGTNNFFCRTCDRGWLEYAELEPPENGDPNSSSGA